MNKHVFKSILVNKKGHQSKPAFGLLSMAGGTGILCKPCPMAEPAFPGQKGLPGVGQGHPVGSLSVPSKQHFCKTCGSQAEGKRTNFPITQ